MKKIIVLFFMLTVCSVTFADNALMNYFRQWVDETRVEIAIGNLILNHFSQEISKEYSIQENQELSKRFAAFAEKSGAKSGTMDFKVLVINSDIPDEILLPGGTLIVTKGYLQYAASEEQMDFILARNAFLTFKKQPLVVIKHEGIYPKFLDAIRTPEAKLSVEKLRDLLRAYLSVTNKMNHKQADVQGALLTSNPEATRKAAVEMMSRFSVKVWPPLPFDTIDLPSRIADLKSLRLPEQKL